MDVEAKDSFVTRWYEESEKIAKKHARRTPGLTAEDLQQDLAVFILEHLGSLQGLPNGSVATILDKRAAQMSRSARSDFMYHSGQYLYRPEEVREALPAFYSHGDWMEAPVPEEARDLGGFEGPTVCADISRVIDRLSITQQAVLRLAFEDRTTVNTGHVSRAVDALTDLLNDSARREGRV